MKKIEQVNTISKERLQKAIAENFGIKTLTAKALKICRNTLNKHIEKHNLSEFLEDQKEVIRDLVRLNIVNAIKTGDIKVSLWYAERQMFEEFGERKTIISKNDSYKDMTDEELQAEIDRLSKAGF
jgi:chemotaxis methyl-accepting protein methylase